MSVVHYKKFDLQFKRPSGTSRGVLQQKRSWFILEQNAEDSLPAVGECSLIEGLSPDRMTDYEEKLKQVCDWLNDERSDCPDLLSHPSIKFGLEMFLSDKAAGGNKIHYQSDFTQGKSTMLINGLVWMGSHEFMIKQVKNLNERGFHCIKLKIGAMDFEEELRLLKTIRNTFGPDLELRVDANGAFSIDEALSKLEKLAKYNLHSIEQPIQPGHREYLQELCTSSPIDIALDEELIGINNSIKRRQLLDQIKPQYIILKPSLLGGWRATNDWIQAAESKEIGWWITSALESNIGLNAIAQYTYEQGVEMPQGLGTGSLYTNNLDSALYLEGENIGYKPSTSWNLNTLINE